MDKNVVWNYGYWIIISFHYELRFGPVNFCPRLLSTSLFQLKYCYCTQDRPLRLFLRSARYPQMPRFLQFLREFWPVPLPLMIHPALALFAQRTRIPTSARSIGFCVIWVCISSSSSSPLRQGGIIFSDYFHSFCTDMSESKSFFMTFATAISKSS